MQIGSSCVAFCNLRFHFVTFLPISVFHSLQWLKNAIMWINHNLFNQPSSLLLPFFLIICYDIEQAHFSVCCAESLSH